MADDPKRDQISERWSANPQWGGVGSAKSNRLPILLLAFAVLAGLLAVTIWRGHESPWGRFAEIRRSAGELVHGGGGPELAGCLPFLGLLILGPALAITCLIWSEKRSPGGPSMVLRLLILGVGCGLFTLAAPGALLEHPSLALAPAAVFFAAAVHLLLRTPLRRGASALLAGVGGYWLLYTYYEHEMLIWSRSVSAPIRADILVTMPLLFATGLCGLWLWLANARAAPPAEVRRRPAV